MVDYEIFSDSSPLIIYSCPLCKSNAQTIVYQATVDPTLPLAASDFDCTNPGHGEHYQIVRCVECGMQYCSPRPSVDQIAQAYQESEDSSYIEGEEGRRQTFRRALKRIGHRSGKLLDIGCNTGVFLEEARTFGYQPYGIEPSHYAVKRAQEVKQLDVHCGVVPCPLPWQHLFQVITLWDVIEHVDQPLEISRFVYDLLDSGGEFHLSTMNVSALFPLIAGERWPWYMRMHIQYFNKRSMRRMLIQAGFKKVLFFNYCHVIHKEYLYKKLEHLAWPLQIIGKVGAFFLADKQGYIPVHMGDMMHVVAYKA